VNRRGCPGPPSRPPDLSHMSDAASAQAAEVKRQASAAEVAGHAEQVKS